MYLGRRGRYYFSFWVAYATADGWIGETRLQAVNWEFCDTPAGIVLIAPTDNPDSCPTRGTAAVPEPCVIVSRGDLFNLSTQRRPQLFYSELSRWPWRRHTRLLIVNVKSIYIVTSFHIFLL